MLRLRTFGGLALEGADGPLTGRAVQPRRLALLTILAATNDGRGVSRDTLQTLLWPESDADSARHSLYQAIHVLRHDLGADDLILGSAELRLNPHRLQSDVAEFEAGLRVAPSEQVVGVYAGSFLLGFYLREAPEFERWAEERRAELARLWRGAVETLAEQAMTASDPRTAAGWWRRLTDADPLDTTAAMGLVRSLAAAGDRSGAIVQAERHVRALKQELGVAPDSDFTALCQRLRTEPAVESGRPAQKQITAMSLELPIPAPSATRRRSWRSIAVGGLAVAAVGLVLGHSESTLEIPSPGAAASLADGGTSERRLAVLPFKNLGQPADLYFADGLRDEIASRLATIPQIAVVARTSVNEYRESSKPLPRVAEELAVEYVLTGSVSWDKAADGSSRIRVIPQLIRTRDGQQLWADRFEAQLADIFAVQGRIAERAAAALGVALGAPERQRLLAAPTTSLAAYDAYLQGNSKNERRRYYVIGERYAGLTAYQRAVELDPSFAAAFAKLASSHLRLYELEDDKTPERARLAKAALDRAVVLAPTTVETRLARADYENTVNGRPDRALSELQAAAGEQPNNVEILYLIGRSLTAQGKLQEALAIYQRALALDPRGSNAPAELLHVSDWLHRYQDAIEYREREITLNPRSPGSYLNQAWSYLAWRGDTAAARHMLARGIDAAGRGLIAEDLARYGGISSIIVPLLDSATVRVLDTLSQNVLALDESRFHLLKGQLFSLTGRPKLARLDLDSARVLLEQELRRTPENQYRRLYLAQTYSALGLPQQTVPLAREILASAASQDGFLVEDTWLAVAAAYVRAGDERQAIDALRALMRSPRHPTAAWIRADPIWGPLHADPRFEQLLAKAP